MNFGPLIVPLLSRLFTFRRGICTVQKLLLLLLLELALLLLLLRLLRRASQRVRCVLVATFTVSPGNLVSVAFSSFGNSLLVKFISYDVSTRTCVFFRDRLSLKRTAFATSRNENHLPTHYTTPVTVGPSKAIRSIRCLFNNLDRCRNSIIDQAHFPFYNTAVPNLASLFRANSSRFSPHESEIYY